MTTKWVVINSRKRRLCPMAALKAIADPRHSDHISGLIEFRLETAHVEERFGFRPEWLLEDQLAELVERARRRHESEGELTDPT